ncbi:MAG: DUF3011 domain-containing protein [Bryobacterales bacterium]|nr:DUF3011 domain-containing protein [Bryobacterales bacterium]
MKQFLPKMLPLFVTCLAAPAAQAQYPFQLSTDAPHLSCVSTGNPVFCDADTHGGVQLVRQFQNSAACIEGQTWGFTDRGVWVDQGCAGEFTLMRVAAVGTIPAGTTIPVRTDERIDAVRLENRFYHATVDQDVWGLDGRLAIPRGSPVELTVRPGPGRDLIVDLESITVNGQRYGLVAEPNRLGSQSGPGVGANRSTAEHVGGGAALGAIIGAIAGGGTGAAVGAGVGGAGGAGLQMATRGREVHVPAESLLTFSLQQPLMVGFAGR